MVKEKSNLLNAVNQISKKEDETYCTNRSCPGGKSMLPQRSNAYAKPGSVKKNVVNTVNDQGFSTNFHDQWRDIFKDLGNPDKKGKNNQYMP